MLDLAYIDVTKVNGYPESFPCTLVAGFEELVGERLVKFRDSRPSIRVTDTLASLNLQMSDLWDELIAAITV